MCLTSVCSSSVPPNTAETSHLFIASYATDLESESASAAPPDPLGAAEVAYTTALADGAENLMLTHVNAWADLWDQSAIEVEGDELLARAVWSAAYPIVSSIRLDWFVRDVLFVVYPASLPQQRT